MRPAKCRRLDDATAHLDHLLAHGTLLASLVVAIVAAAFPAMRGGLVGAAVIGGLAALRLTFHPLRFVALSRVYVQGGQVLVAPALGRARPVEVVRVLHESHSPWPCRLELRDGRRIAFVARRDDGSGAFFDLELSDRARYDRPSDARDSINEISLVMRGTIRD